MNMHMHHCLTRILPILHSHVVLHVINRLQLLPHLLGSHEQVQCLYLCEVLELGNHPSRTDQHMTLDEGTVVYQAEYVLSHQEDLGTGNYCVVEHKVADQF
jgi:hypothetical protein